MLIVAVLPSAAAQDASAYAEVAFTPIITDAADHADFWDIREIALGEPGDGTIVFRITVESWSIPGLPTGSVDVFFDAGGSSWRSGVNTAGSPASSQPFDACVRDGDVAYCTFTYETLDVVPGDVISSTRAISYAGVAQDYAPGGHYVPDGVTGPRGDDYVITGGPDADGALPAEALANLTLVASATNATGTADSIVQYMLNLTNAGTAATNFSLNATDVPDGVNLSFDPVQGLLEANASIQVAVEATIGPNASAGPHNFTVLVDGFQNATIRLSLVVEAPELGHDDPVGNATAEEADTQLPAPGAPVVLAVLAAALMLLVRKRRA
jgi:hypothetical protein